MELYLELLFTAVLSVVLVFLLGKIFSVDVADAAEDREREHAEIVGERQGKDFVRSDQVDARDRSDPAKKCEEEKGFGVCEVGSGEISAKEMTGEVEIERRGLGERSIDIEICEGSQVRVDSLGNIFEVSTAAEDDAVREMPECLEEAKDVNFGLERKEVDAGVIETRFESSEAMVGSSFFEEEDGIENRFEVSTVEDSSVGGMPRLNESESLEEAKELQFEAMADDNSSREMPRLNKSERESLEEAKELIEATAKDILVREMPRPNEVESLDETKFQFGVEKEVDAAKSETEWNVEKIDAHLVEEEECRDNVAGPPVGEEIVLKEGYEGEKRGNDEMGQSLLSGEDDWEGIERTELQKCFHEAAAYVYGVGGEFALLSLSDDEQMQLYGLHKVATEGPCYDPQPMALKVSARAKWHAWQRLGNMNPDAAMEQYMSLLSAKIPEWMGEKAEGDVEKHEGSEVTEAALSGTGTPEFCSNIHSKLSAESKRTQELPCINEASGSAIEEHSAKAYIKGGGNYHGGVRHPQKSLHSG